MLCSKIIYSDVCLCSQQWIPVSPVASDSCFWMRGWLGLTHTFPVPSLDLINDVREQKGGGGEPLIIDE